jgi:ribosomal protein S18 acetylase RimI-like enzyme
MEDVIDTAKETDGLQIQDITARAGVFSEEEIDSVRVMWSEFLSFGPHESGYTFIVYRDGDQVLGFAIYGYRDLADGVYDLYWIAVDPNARRRSVGRELITACENAVRDLGGRMLIAETSGTPHYEPTRKFYFGMGFHDEAVIRDFYSTGDDLVIFVKRV